MYNVQVYATARAMDAATGSGAPDQEYDSDDNPLVNVWERTGEACSQGSLLSPVIAIASVSLARHHNALSHLKPHCLFPPFLMIRWTRRPVAMWRRWPRSTIRRSSTRRCELTRV